MKTKILRQYINAAIDARIPTLPSIQQALILPQRFVTDDDADECWRCSKRLTIPVSISLAAHFKSSQRITKPDIAQSTIRRVLTTGAVIRTQSPVMRHINDQSGNPYCTCGKAGGTWMCAVLHVYCTGHRRSTLLCGRTGTTWRIFRKAYQKVSGIARTVRVPSMSAGTRQSTDPGHQRSSRRKVFVLQFHGTKPGLGFLPFRTLRPFIWLDYFIPPSKKQFFFETEYALSRKPKPVSRLIKQKIPVH